MNRTPTWIKVLYVLMLPCALANVALALLLAYIGSLGLALLTAAWGVYCHWIFTKRPRD